MGRSENHIKILNHHTWTLKLRWGSRVIYFYILACLIRLNILFYFMALTLDFRLCSFLVCSMRFAHGLLWHHTKWPNDYTKTSQLRWQLRVVVFNILTHLFRLITRLNHYKKNTKVEMRVKSYILIRPFMLNAFFNGSKPGLTQIRIFNLIFIVHPMWFEFGLLWNHSKGPKHYAKTP